MCTFFVFAARRCEPEPHRAGTTVAAAMAYCEVCERYFPSDVALAQHNLMSEIHNYDCWRCKRHLESRHALAQHVRDSARHHVCDACDVDFETEDGLEEHKESEHNACRECGRYFDTPSNLFHVRRPDPSSSCAACYASPI